MIIRMESFSKILMKYLMILFELNHYWLIPVDATTGHKGSICNTLDINQITTDYLLISRCLSICNTNPDSCCTRKCVQKYLKNSAYKKYGDCPKSPANKMEAICINACGGFDYKCPGIEKCCAHECGMSCQEPVGLDKNNEVPDIPYNVLIEEHASRKYPYIQWDMNEKSVNNNSLHIVVESRSHIGPKFFEHKLSDWALHMPVEDNHQERTAKYFRYYGKIRLKLGRWYQFRVALINNLGTKGYSNYSKEFQMSKRPKPPKPPKNLTIGPLKANPENHMYNRRISWSLPKSDLPIEKYKISWSLYLKEKDNANESLIKDSDFVFEPTRHYEFRNLLPNSTYYVQVHAISVYGRKRLKSGAESTMMNTSDALDTDFAQTILAENLLMNDERANQSSRTQLLNSLQIKFTATRKNGVNVKIMWSENIPDRIILDLCKGGHECLNKPINKYQYRVATKRNSFEFTNRQYGTTYTVGFHSFGKANGDGTPTIYKTFTTPHCTTFQKKYHNSKLKCQHPKVLRDINVNSNNNKLIDN